MYWFAASTPDGDGPLMQAKWKMLRLHIQILHADVNNNLYPECGHGELGGEARTRLWLIPGTQINNYD